MVMEKLKVSQILKLFLITALCIITPLLSTSFRPKYLYFIVNILIIAVGAESGVASFFLKAADNYKKPTQKPQTSSSDSYPRDDKKKSLDQSTQIKVFKKSLSEKIAETVKPDKALDRSSSTPSLFFIGEEKGNEEDVDGEEVEGLSGQELYQKAEKFIGNFYDQLKMQREESRKKLQNIYQKTF